jgi:hypothetical protein
MDNFGRHLAFCALILLLPVVPSSPERPSDASDSLAVILHSASLADQREALKVILDNSQKYVPRIQQSLRDYPRLLRTDPTTAKRAAYISALLRDPSFPPILAKSLNVPDVLDDCEYACPVVFDLTVQACFGGWKVPVNLDSQLTTVNELRAEIDRMSRLSLKVGSLDDVVQGPDPENRRKDIDKKTEDELIALAGPANASTDTRLLPAFRLQTLVSGSKNRINLYLLALNDFQDASGEYRGAVYQSIYRAELAKSRGL